MKNTIKITILAFVLTLTANVAFGQQSLWAYKRDEGVKQLAAKNYTEAVKSFTECIDDNEKADQCYSGRGKAYDALGKSIEAADDFSAALKINPQNQQATEGLASKKGNSQKPKEKAKDDDEYADVLKELDDQFDSMNKSDNKKTEKQTPKSSDDKTPAVSNECISGNCLNGKGTIKNQYYTYEGDFVDGKWHGQGTRTDYTGDTYTGQFANNKFNGKGKYKYINGSYEGDFVDGKREGQGTDTKAGSIYTGQFKNDKRNGYGKEYDKWRKTWKEGNWKDNVFVSSTTGVLVPTASSTVTSPTVPSPNSAANETATLLRQTLNGKFDIMEGKPLTYVLKMKKSGETFFYQIEFINDGSGKLAFKWKESTKKEQSEKLMITDTGLASASKYINFYTTKTAIAPDNEIAFILSQTLYRDLKAKKEITVDLGKGPQRMSYNYDMTALTGIYSDKTRKILYFQSDDRKTTMEILDDPICPLITGIDTGEYTLTL